MGVKDVSTRWLKASRALKKKDQVYGQMLAQMAKKHSSEAFYAIDDPLEAAVFSHVNRNDGVNTSRFSSASYEPRPEAHRRLGAGGAVEGAREEARRIDICGFSILTPRAAWNSGAGRGLTKASVAYPPSFYMHLKDPPPTER